ncbi:hypothetical protein B6K85_13400 [Vibrio sp. V1B]|nr:hypothetical protein B6K85_13400 [Vibrio sp. V1B]
MFLTKTIALQSIKNVVQVCELIRKFIPINKLDWPAILRTIKQKPMNTKRRTTWLAFLVLNKKLTQQLS